MAVKNTRPWLEDFVEACKKETLRLQQPYQQQQDYICKPVTEAGLSVRELQSILLKHGLFEPREWRDVAKAARQLERKGTWKVVAREYRRLKRKWQGPDTAIYIFPVAQFQLPARRRSIVKSGLSFRRCLFLFLGPDNPDIEIKALLAHEYNHICRLEKTKYKADEMPLKEALVMEGLAEYAVKEMYGEKQVSHWTKRYRERDIVTIWKNHFLPQLELKGQENYQPFLNGKSGTLPEWIGYQIGYEIVDDFQRQKSVHSMPELLRLSADKLIAGSFFRM